MRANEYKKLKDFYLYVEEQLTTEDIENILYDLGVEQIKKENKIWKINTICHNEQGGKLNLVYYPDNKSFFCFSECNKSYNIFQLVQQRHNLTDDTFTSLQALKYVCEFKEITFNYKTKSYQSTKCDWQSRLGIYLGETNEEYKEIIFEPEIIDNFPMIYHTDWLSEGLSIKTLSKFNVRYYPYKNQIVIPCTNINGSLIGIRVRNMETGKDKPKYTSLTMLNGDKYNFPTLKYFYGIEQNHIAIKNAKTVWLVESEKAVMKSTQWFGDKSLALGMYCHNLGEERVLQLTSLGVEKVVLFIDSDFKERQGDEWERFYNTINNIKKQLNPYITNIEVVYNNINLDMYKQNAFDRTKEEFKILWKNRKKLK